MTFAMTLAKEEARRVWKDKYWRQYHNLEGAIDTAMSTSKTLITRPDEFYNKEEYRAQRDLAVQALTEATDMGLMPIPNTGTILKTFDWVRGQHELREQIDAGESTVTYHSQPIYWDQGTWHAVHSGLKSCRTAMCFAGHVCDTAGVEWTDSAEPSIWITQELNDQFPELVRLRSYEVGDRVDVASMASVAMNIHGLEGQHLYSGGNTFDEITAVLDVIFTRAGEQLQLV